MTKSSTAALADSVPQRIICNAERFGGRNAFTFLERGETVSATLSYEELVGRVTLIAGSFAAEGLTRQPVMIILPAGIDFVSVFLACLWTRSPVIPVPFPSMFRALERVSTVLLDARPAAIVTDDATAAMLRASELGPGLPRILRLSSFADSAPSAIGPCDGSPDQPALIQYTSGSTRTPRGIAVTHGNLLANQRMIAAAFRGEEGDVGVCWLPHFHDMGLLGGILQSLFIGGSSVLMDPFAFVQRPVRWLRAISKYRATTAGGPSFAYDLCARHCTAADVSELDLSSWRVAFCGAEPIRQPVLDRFAVKFACAAFDRRSFLPCYGLAEATLIVTCAEPGRGSRLHAVARESGAIEAPPFLAVSCGAPVPECSIRIRSEDGAEIGPGQAGEIWVAGPHVTPGYWDGEERRIAPYPEARVDAQGELYIPTGDIGAMVGGELVPVDRIKDTVILYGQKLHASDIEARLLEHPLGVDLLAACAFAVEGAGPAQLVVLCEMERRAFRSGGAVALASALPMFIAETFGTLPRLEIVPYGALPRTTSGKIQRRKSREAFVRGEFEKRPAALAS